MRVLFVDDVRDNCELFSLVFRLEGFDTYTAANGLEAVAAVQRAQEPFDVVVLDIGMPVMDGWQTLAALRQLPQCQDVPVILFTGYRGSDLALRAQAAGAADLLHKPILPTDMTDAVLRVAQQSRAQPSRAAHSSSSLQHPSARENQAPQDAALAPCRCAAP
jgi:CheY-like chemotaxis protein